MGAERGPAVDSNRKDVSKENFWGRLRKRWGSEKAREGRKKLEERVFQAFEALEMER